MIKVFSIWLMCAAASFRNDRPDKIFYGYLSRNFSIDTTANRQELGAYGLLYAFVSDTSKTSRNINLLYGLLKNTDTLTGELLNYSTRLRINYREYTGDDIKDVTILNRHKFFNVRFYLITGIQKAE